MRLTKHSRNILFLYSGNVASRFIGMAAVGYLARVIGPAGFGTISIGLAILSYGMILGNSGLTVLGTRKVAGKVEEIGNLVTNIFIIRLFLSITIYLMGIVIAYFTIPSQKMFFLIAIYLLGVFPASFLLEWFYQGCQKLKTIASGQILSMLAYFIFIVALVRHSNNILWVAWAWIFGMSVNSIFLWVKFRTLKYEIHYNWDRLQIRSLLLEALPLGFAALIAQFVTQFPPVFLGLVATRIDVGLFSAAFKLVVFLLIFDQVFYAIFFPNVSRCFRQSPEKLEETVNRVLKLTSLFVLSVGLIVIPSSQLIISLIFGSAFINCVPLLQIMIGLFVFKLMNSVFTFTLIGIEQEKVYTKSLIWGMGIFFLMLLVLTKPFGTIGVAIALICFEVTALIVMFYALKDHVVLHFIRSFILPFMGTCCLMIPFLLIFPMHLPLQLAISFIIGIPFIAWLCNFGSDDIQYLRKILI